jgi:hypothetical protein
VVSATTADLPAPIGPWQSLAYADGPPTVQVAPTASGFLVRTAGGITFALTPDGILHRAESAPLRLEHILADLAVPLWRASRGELVLHGALLARRQEGLAVLAESGGGKSTVAAAWAAAGGRVMSDDWLLVRLGGHGVEAFGSHPSLRLSAEGQDLSGFAGEARGRLGGPRDRTWFRLSEDGFHAGPLPLAAVYALVHAPAGPEAALVTDLAPAEAFRLVLSASFVLERDRAPVWQAHLDRLRRLCHGVPVRRIAVRSGRAGLEAVRMLLSGP